MSVPSLSGAVRPSTCVGAQTCRSRAGAGRPPGLGLCATSAGLPCLRQKGWVLRGNLRARLMGSAGRAWGESSLRRPLGFPRPPLTPALDRWRRQTSQHEKGWGRDRRYGQGRWGVDGSRCRCAAALVKRVSRRSAPRRPQGFLVRGRGTQLSPPQPGEDHTAWAPVWGGQSLGPAGAETEEPCP